MKRNSLDELYEVSGGNPLLILQILGLISQKGYSISTAINLLRDAEKSKDAYAFLFSHAANSLSDDEKSVLSTLAFQKFATVESIKAATNLPTNKVESSLDTLVKLSLVNDPLAGKYALHSLITNYVQMILRQEIPSQNTQLGNITLDPEANSRMLSYWVEFAKENSQNTISANSTIQSEWSNLESTAIALYEMTGLPVEIKDSRTARQLVDLALALCDRNAPLFALGYWDESVKLAHWGFQASQKIKQSANAVKLAEYIAYVYSLRDQVDNISTLSEQLHDLDILSENSKPSVVMKSRASLKEIKRLLLSSPQEKIKLENEVLESCIEAGDSAGEAQVRTELAVLYLERNDHTSADKELDKALQIAKRENDKYLQARILNVMGDRAMHTKPYFVDIVIAPLFEKIDFDNLNMVMQAVYIVAFLLLMIPVLAVATVDWLIEDKLRGEDVKGNPQRAFECYQNAFTLASSVDARYELANSKLGMAKIYLKNGNKLDAKECAIVALGVYERLSLKRKIQEAKKIIESADKP